MSNWTIDALSFAPHGAVFNAMGKAPPEQFNLACSNQRRLTAIAVSGDRKFLATSSFDSVVRVWDYTAFTLWESGDDRKKPLQVLYMPSIPTALRFTPSQKKDAKFEPHEHSAMATLQYQVDDLLIAMIDGQVLRVGISSGDIFESFNLYDAMKSSSCSTNNNRILTAKGKLCIHTLGLLGETAEYIEKGSVYFCVTGDMLLIYDMKNRQIITQFCLSELCLAGLQVDASKKVVSIEPIAARLLPEKRIQVFFGVLFETECMDHQAHWNTLMLQTNACTAPTVQDAPFDVTDRGGILIDPSMRNLIATFMKFAQERLKGINQNQNAAGLNGALTEIKSVHILENRGSHIIDKLLEVVSQEHTPGSEIDGILQECVRSHGLEKAETKASAKRSKENRVMLAAQVDETDKEQEELVTEIEKLTEVKEAWLSYIETLT